MLLSVERPFVGASAFHIPGAMLLHPVAVEIGPLRQVENLPGDVFGGQRQCFFTGEGDRFHSVLPSHASSIAFSGSGSAKVASHLEPREAAAVCAQAAAPFVVSTAIISLNADEAITRTPEPPSQWPAAGLSMVLSRVQPDEQQGRLIAVTTALSVLTNPPGAVGGCPLLKPALEPLPCSLTDQQLVELLKNPFCIGPARRLVLDQFANRYRRPFADLWEFVRFAEEQQFGLDFTSPPKRPAIPHAGR
jgi:hypothetical protein